MRYITLSEFESTKISNVNDERKIEILKNILTDITAISKFYTCYPLFKVYNENNSKDVIYYLNEIFLTHPTLKISIRYSYKKYSFYCEDIRELKNITYYTEKEAKKKLTEPKQVGVLTTKKIQDWVDYYTNLYNALKVQNDGNTNVINDFLKSIEHLNVRWSQNKISGSIVTNGIEFTFKINETHVSQSINIHYNMANNLETFLKLSDNKIAS